MPAARPLPARADRGRPTPRPAAARPSPRARGTSVAPTAWRVTAHDAGGHPAGSHPTGLAQEEEMALASDGGREAVTAFGGKIALVTGASHGTGVDIAVLLARAGARV